MRSFIIFALVLCFNLQAKDCPNCSKAKGSKAKTTKTTKAKLKVMKCPVLVVKSRKAPCDGTYCSGKIDKKLFIKHKGQNVYFCCKGCVKEFKKNPKPYLKEVENQLAQNKQASITKE